jgi:hypothetical protein
MQQDHAALTYSSSSIKNNRGSTMVKLVGAGNQFKKELQSKLPADVTLALTPTSEFRRCIELLRVSLHIWRVGNGASISKSADSMLRRLCLPQNG